MMNLAQIQQALRDRQIDGWLCYDLHHRDPIAYRVLGLPSDAICTRRWYYLIPASGEPVKLVHRIEPDGLNALPGEKRVYASWQEHDRLLAEIVKPLRSIAMQYSPLNRVPAVSMVDGGTVELVRSFGPEVVSSADLVQQFEARWSPAALQTHAEAGRLIDGIIDDAFIEIGRRVMTSDSTDEYTIQQFILECFAASGLTTDMPPIVAVNGNSGNPHYEPTSDRSAPIREGDFVLLDVWGKRKTPGAVYYDITWVGFVGMEVPERIRTIFEIVKAARDTGVELVRSSVEAGRKLCGWEVDRAVRDVITQSGYGDQFPHRTGHSIGQEVHGNGANMDDLETHDERRIIPYTCFSIEPGIYLPEFGVRSEVNVFVTERSAGVTGRIQQAVVRVAV
jgi:Xaa-Pro dipeptidase